jgi:hypothetical protein
VADAHARRGLLAFPGRTVLRPRLRGCAYGLGRGGLGLGALDRRALLADRDRDLARLARFGLGDPYLEHAAIEARAHALRIDVLGKRQRARESS